MATNTEEIDRLRTLTTELSLRLRMLEEQTKLVLDISELVRSNNTLLALVVDRQAQAEKRADRWSGRVWQIVLAVWVSVMGILSALALTGFGLKK